MSEPCIHEEDFGTIKSTLGRMDKEIFGNGKKGLSHTVIELSGEVKNLEKTAEQLRIGVAGLLKFQNEYAGGEKKSTRNWKTFGVVISFVALLSGMYFGFKEMQRSSADIERQVKEVMDVVYEPQFRSGDTIDYE